MTAPRPMAGAAGAPLIACRHLTKTYVMGQQALTALNDVSFDIARGEFVAIMGPSGSGKSTLLNLLGALDVPTSGSLTIAGAEIAGLDATQLAHLRNKVIGFVFQQFNLLRRTTAVDNVKLPLLYAPNAPEDGDARARRCLEEVGLGERLDHTPSQLSGGQQQRVAIARALVTGPQMILADEPTGALDSETSKDIMALFTALNARGLTIILVTHESEIAAYAGRVLRFRDGRVIEDIPQHRPAGAL